MSHLEYGSVVWVRLGQTWWPGSITTITKCPPEFVKAIRKTPIAIVKFFHENEFQDVHKSEHISPYNCDRKVEFIKKGQGVHKNQSHGDVDLLTKFESDVVTAEKLTGGDMNILQTLGESAGKRRIDYSDLGFGPPKAKRKRSEEVTRRGGTDIGQAVVYKRFGRGGTQKVVVQHKVRILEQPRRELAEEDMRSATSWFKCCTCGFTCSRLNVIVWHNKAHLNKVINYDSGIKIPGRRRRRGGARGRPPKRKNKVGKDSGNLDHAHTNGDIRGGRRDLHDTEQILMDWDDDEETGDRPAPPPKDSDDGYSDADNDYPPPQPRYQRQPMPKPADINSAFDALLAATPTSTNTHAAPGQTYAKNDSDSDYSDWEKYYARDSGSGSEEEEVEQESDIKSLCEAKEEEKNHTKHQVQEEKEEEVKDALGMLKNEIKIEEDDVKMDRENGDKAPSPKIGVPVTAETDGHLYVREELIPALEEGDEEEKMSHVEEEVDEKSSSTGGAGGREVVESEVLESEVLESEVVESIGDPSDDNSDLVEYMEEPEERTPHMSPVEVEDAAIDDTAQPVDPIYQSTTRERDQLEAEDEVVVTMGDSSEQYTEAAGRMFESPEDQDEPVNFANTRHHRSPSLPDEPEEQFVEEEEAAGVEQEMTMERGTTEHYQEPPEISEDEDAVRVQLGEDGAEIIDADEDSEPRSVARRDQESIPTPPLASPHARMQEVGGDSGTGTTYMLVAVDAHGNTVPTVPTPALESGSSNLVAVEATMEDGTARTLYIDPAQLGPNVDLNNLVLHIDTTGQEHVIIPPSTAPPPTSHTEPHTSPDPMHVPDTTRHQYHHSPCQEYHEEPSHHRQYHSAPSDSRHYPMEHSDDSRQDPSEPSDLSQQVRPEHTDPRQEYHHHHIQVSDARQYEDEPSKPRQYQDEPSDPRQYQDEPLDPRQYQDEPSDLRQYQEESSESSRQYQEESSDPRPYQDEPSDLTQYQDEPSDLRQYQDEPSDLRQFQSQTSEYRQYSSESRSTHHHHHHAVYGARSATSPDYQPLSPTHPEYHTTTSTHSDSYHSSPTPPETYHTTSAGSDTYHAASPACPDYHTTPPVCPSYHATPSARPDAYHSPDPHT